jgi:hypothetical protein
MSIEFLKEDESGHRHSVMVGKKCAYCGDCGKILVEYKNKDDFKRLMNPFGDKELD